MPSSASPVPAPDTTIRLKLHPRRTMGMQSRSSTASYPLLSCSTAKLSSSWRRGKAIGPGGSGSSCGSASSSRLCGPDGE